MRNVVLLSAVLGVATFGLIGCGDASPAGSGRHGTYEPGDPNDPGETNNAPADPDSTSAPAAPTTPGTAGSDFTVAVDKTTPQVNLGDSTQSITATISAVGSFTGSGTVTVTGLPTGVNVVVAPATVQIGATPVTAKINFNVGLNAAFVAAGTPIVVSVASGSAAPATANVTFKVNNALMMTIPVNVDALNAAGKNTSFGAQLQGDGNSPTFATGLAVTVYNADSTVHIVHGQNGFQHGDTGNPIAATSMEGGATPLVRNLVAGQTPSGYLHSQGTIDPQGTNSPFAFKIQ